MPIAPPMPDLVTRLDSELTAMAIAQFDSSEFRAFFDLPMTLERGRYYATQMVFYNKNRRECWAHVQSKAPWEVMRVIWEHEKDELFHDVRGGTDHRELMSKEAIALGVPPETLAKAEPTPLVDAVQMAFAHASATLPWLGGLTLNHFLERRNNGSLIPDGGWSMRIRTKLIRELHVKAELLISTNVHVDADIDHSDAVWEAVAAGLTSAHAYETALEGAHAAVRLDRALRAAWAYEMRDLG
jgi:Iron-containing redox enzyme